VSKTSNKAATPLIPAIPVKVDRAGKGGIVPPVEHQFKFGNRANPLGRPAAGLSIIEFINELQNHTRAELRAVSKDPRVPANKRVAAKEWLRALSNRRNVAGNDQAGSTIDRIIDRTAGKAKQHIEVSNADLAATLDLTRLTIEQVGQFRMLLAIATGHEIPEVSAQPALEAPK
jgi:hypothetical protein